MVMRRFSQCTTVSSSIRLANQCSMICLLTAIKTNSYNRNKVNCYKQDKLHGKYMIGPETNKGWAAVISQTNSEKVTKSDNSF